ncbi:MAG TPA: adenylate kinase [Candidatus Gastranaerophilaceae bacterium]|nr:adenylate kinase [Candidatus Gastranaerophilaceae bacterium]HPT42011.1 adenylate kinase [Candidatus Gastranaerophilaceae bacterium]
MKKELVFLGPPACGKGTQTSKLALHLNFPHVDTGSLLRKAMADKTSDGLIAQSYVEKGQLVPVDIVASIIKSRLKESDCKSGFILDGYPRSTEQAILLEEMLKEIDAGEEVDFKVIYFDIDQKLLMERIIYRRSCAKCGKIYNLLSLKPRKDGVCDECGCELIQRKDDTEEIAKSRFDTYFEQTAPLIKFYEQKGSLKKIDANGSVDEVWDRLLSAI